MNLQVRGRIFSYLIISAKRWIFRSGAWFLFIWLYLPRGEFRSEDVYWGQKTTILSSRFIDQHAEWVQEYHHWVVTLLLIYCLQRLHFNAPFSWKSVNTVVCGFWYVRLLCRDSDPSSLQWRLQLSSFSEMFAICFSFLETVRNCNCSRPYFSRTHCPRTLCSPPSVIFRICRFIFFFFPLPYSFPCIEEGWN